MYEIIGYERLTKNLFGESRPGYYLHLVYSTDDTVGSACTSGIVSDSALNGYIPKLGDIVNFSCNLSGRIISVEVIDNKYD